MDFLQYERRSDSLLPLDDFLKRLARTLAFVFAILAVGLGVGVCGYHWCQGLGWLDSLLNASMILTGMGPVDMPKTAAAKWFGSFYALFSGIVFLTCAGVAFTPVAHRLLHWFHRETRDAEGEREDEDEDPEIRREEEAKKQGSAKKGRK